MNLFGVAEDLVELQERIMASVFGVFVTLVEAALEATSARPLQLVSIQTFA